MASSVARALRDAVAANLANIRKRLADACQRAGRSPSDVELVAVTKYGGPDLVAALIEAGHLDLGENRVDRLLRLAAKFPQARWHMIGHLQRNKAKKIAGVLSALHSVDSVELAEKVDAQRKYLGLAPLRTFVEVNVAAEPQKSGVAPDAIAPLLVPRSHLSVVGLMTIPPEEGDPRPHFKKLAELAKAHGLAGLSMGMTNDFETAIEEGATVVRVGRALYEGVSDEVLARDREALEKSTAGEA